MIHLAGGGNQFGVPVVSKSNLFHQPYCGKLFLIQGMKMSEKLKRIGAIYDSFNNFLAGFAGVVIVFMTLITTAQVFARKLFKYHIEGTTELCEWAILIVPFLGAAWLLRRDGHVKMDLIRSRLKPNIGRRLDVITSILAMLVCLTATWYFAQNTWRDYVTHFYEISVLSFPRAPFSAIVTMGYLLLTVQFARRAVEYWHKSV